MSVFQEFKLHHISYAVRDTEIAMQSFQLLYPTVELLKCEEVSQNVFITYLRNEAKQERVELVEPRKEPNPVSTLLEVHASVLYHVCYEVSHLEQAVYALRKERFAVITKPFASSTLPGYHAAHLYSPNMGVIELVGPLGSLNS